MTTLFKTIPVKIWSPLISTPNGIAKLLIKQPSKLIFIFFKLH